MTISAHPRMAELEQRFLVGLGRRTSDLSVALNGAADSESLMRMFHSLVGIGGTYGYPAITETSRACEALCLNAMEEHRAITFDEKKRLGAAIVSIAAQH